MRALVSLLLCTISLGAFAADRPNIVVFFMDDLGYSDLRIDGARDVRTPNIDRLARSGVRLTDCYAAAPVCTPTRAAFMTGRYQHRVGIDGVISVNRGNGDTGLSAEEPTLPRYLRDAGYATGLFGKWHLGSKPEYRPRRHGFDEFFGFLGSAVDYYSHFGDDGKHDLYLNDEPIHLDNYLTDEITTRAIDFIRRHAQKPFFIDVAYNAVHWPYQPPGLTNVPKESAVSGLPLVRKWGGEGTRQDYVRMLERADEGIGRILATLDALGLRGNTLVIFTSDNGGEWLSRMEPLFNRKGTLWEGGIRVPCILSWRGRLPSGRSTEQPAITMDLTATILAAASAKIRPDRPLDGIDLIPHLQKNAPVVQRTFYWSGVHGSTQRAVRDGRWKLVAETKVFPGMLFDMSADPGERKDLAAQHPDVVRRLDEMHGAWMRSVSTEAPH
ncbi:MAG TPA: sulfatase-like hydrolase/transferase [Thermoanaerobaculia bacterium]